MDYGYARVSNLTELIQFKHFREAYAEKGRKKRSTKDFIEFNY